MINEISELFFTYCVFIEKCIVFMLHALHKGIGVFPNSYTEDVHDILELRSAALVIAFGGAHTWFKKPFQNKNASLLLNIIQLLLFSNAIKIQKGLYKVRKSLHDNDSILGVIHELFASIYYWIFAQPSKTKVKNIFAK